MGKINRKIEVKGKEITILKSEKEDSGCLTSSILDIGHYPKWQSVDWVGIEPVDSDMYFTVRSSNDPDNLGTWSEYIYEPGSLAGYIGDTHRYIQYAVLMEMDCPIGTPVLDEISFQFAFLGIDEGEQNEMLLLPVSPNPQRGCPSLSFVVSEVAFLNLRSMTLQADRCILYRICGLPVNTL